MGDPASEQFSLRWNNFYTNLTSGFHALLQGEDLVDVTIAVDGKFVQAHKIVLSVCSPYFMDLFKVSFCIFFNSKNFAYIIKLCMFVDMCPDRFLQPLL